MQLNELNELRLEAYKSSCIYKERSKKWHDKHIIKKRLERGDILLLFNAQLRLFIGKLKFDGQAHLRSPRFNPIEQLKYGVNLPARL